ncbi:hypothetical protein HYALB_00009534 [Hymenoscyphus albidus]|uniref:Uncharacterized protein n=1 Tax=Hymenoscyphus albidus TaxID=595503 RepID=A0A9N9LVC2_9HELO|nr:hypothetical protein HYALB_00009534 [Hymenoscyphus albidus]
MCFQTIKSYTLCSHHIRYKPEFCRYRYNLLHKVERKVETIKDLCPECHQKEAAGLGRREEDEELSDQCRDEQDSMMKVQTRKSSGKKNGVNESWWAIDNVMSEAKKRS